jgi:hypothetical protein
MMQFTSDREIDPFTAPSTLAIGTLHVRDRVAVGGVVTKLQQRHWSSGSQSLHATISDRTGSVAVVFLGRSHVAGVELGRAVVVAGAVIQRHGLRLIMNPYLWLTEVSGAELEAPGQGLTSTG